MTFLKILLQSMIRLSCRPAIVNGLDRIMMMNTESPWLAVTPDEWYASDMLATMSTDLHQMETGKINKQNKKPMCSSPNW